MMTGGGGRIASLNKQKPREPETNADIFAGFLADRSQEEKEEEIPKPRGEATKNHGSKKMKFCV